MTGNKRYINNNIPPIKLKSADGVCSSLNATTSPGTPSIRTLISGSKRVKVDSLPVSLSTTTTRVAILSQARDFFIDALHLAHFARSGYFSTWAEGKEEDT